MNIYIYICMYISIYLIYLLSISSVMSDRRFSPGPAFLDPSFTPKDWPQRRCSDRMTDGRDISWGFTRPGKRLQKTNNGKIHHAILMGKLTISTGP